MAVEPDLRRNASVHTSLAFGNQAGSFERFSGRYGSQTHLYQDAGKQPAAAGPTGGSRRT